ncbi:MAG: hypothetical protein HFG24_04775 [Anaerotruncus sp.]|nr:hypothetical protein [Anaerotruncus sp.]
MTRPNRSVRARRRLATAMKVAAVIAIGVAVVVMMLYYRAVLTELTLQISSERTKLNEEISEGTRLAAELESKVSLRNVEEYATQKLGMAPLDKSQITYINLNEGDRVELTSESPRQTIADRIQLAISNVQEYLKDK